MISKNIIIDAGSLVALLNKKDHFHSWANQEANKLSPPFLTCEAVITEACFLLHDVYKGEDAVMTLVKMGKIQIPFQFSEEVNSIQELMKRYQSVPMSFADACVVRMAELIPNSKVFTVDSDFYIYRKNRREMIDLIIPN
ncbi:type II toxin-antitoxin system VapC family toxin [Geminocystis sp. CENA526]|uniref:type II toxin-antitoxin system VapC family toxin n=1 Tax=Geminocystis sp. CENA526 TaxID=1355871 RepID=UPI003D6EB870